MNKVTAWKGEGLRSTRKNVRDGAGDECVWNWAWQKSEGETKHPIMKKQQLIRMKKNLGGGSVALLNTGVSSRRVV